MDQDLESICRLKKMLRLVMGAPDRTLDENSESYLNMIVTKISKGGFPKDPIACQYLLQMLILIHKQVNP